jgi:hypothetical protein
MAEEREREKKLGVIRKASRREGQLGSRSVLPLPSFFLG